MDFVLLRLIVLASQPKISVPFPLPNSLHPKLIENLYYKKFIIKDLAKINYKNYHSIKDMFKYIKILFVTKIKYYKKFFFLKNIDTQKFIEKTFNSQIVNESLKYEIFLKSNE